MSAPLLAWQLDKELGKRFEAPKHARVLELCGSRISTSARVRSRSPGRSRHDAPTRRWRRHRRSRGSRTNRALREETPWGLAAERASKMAVELARSRAAGRGYAPLLEWVKQHPVHGSYVNEHNADELLSCAGLEPLFYDPGYLAWVRTQKVAASITSAVMANAICSAAGWDAAEYAYGVVESPDHGRTGRMLSLLVLGGTLDVTWPVELAQKRKPKEVLKLLGAKKQSGGMFRVAGTFHMEFDVYDEQLGLTSIPAVQAMLGRGDQVMGIEMTVEDLARSDEVAEAVEQALGGTPYQAMDWYELNKQLFTAMGHARP
jgi:hypothetical protein